VPEAQSKSPPLCMRFDGFVKRLATESVPQYGTFSVPVVYVGRECARLTSHECKSIRDSNKPVKRTSTCYCLKLPSA